jgi:hypothetical protein
MTNSTFDDCTTGRSAGLGAVAFARPGAAACTVIAMQDGGTGAGAQHGGAGREANLIFVLPPNVYVGPPGRGTFWFQIFIQAPSLEIWRKTISGAEGGSGEEVGWPVLGYLLGKNYRRHDRAHAAVSCRTEVCYSFARHGRHRAVKRREFIALLGGAAASADGGGAAAGDASDRLSQQQVICRRALTPRMRALLHLSLSRSGRRGQRHQQKGCGYV